jgi:hypothetical protein
VIAALPPSAAMGGGAVSVKPHVPAESGLVVTVDEDSVQALTRVAARAAAINTTAALTRISAPSFMTPVSPRTQGCNPTSIEFLQDRRSGVTDYERLSQVESSSLHVPVDHPSVDVSRMSITVARLIKISAQGDFQFAAVDAVSSFQPDQCSVRLQPDQCRVGGESDTT